MTTKEDKGCCKAPGTEHWDSYMGKCVCKCHGSFVDTSALRAIPQEDNTWENELLTLIETNWQEMNGDELIEIDPVEWFAHVLTEERVKWKLNNSFDVAKVIKQGKKEALAMIRAKLEPMREVYDDDVDQRNDKYRFEGYNKALQDILIEVEKLLNEI